MYQITLKYIQLLIRTNQLFHVEVLIEIAVTEGISMVTICNIEKTDATSVSFIQVLSHECITMPLVILHGCSCLSKHLLFALCSTNRLLVLSDNICKQFGPKSRRWFYC